MIEDKHLLKNGNVLLWLPGNREDNIENVLILAGGNVLLLKSIKHVSMISNGFRNDLITLSFDELVKKYKLDGYEDIYYDLRYELKSGNYPKYEENNIEKYVLSILDHLPGVSKDCLLMIKGKCNDELKKLKEGKKEMSKDLKERKKELEDLAKERFIGKDGISMADYLTNDEYEELLELEEKLEKKRKKNGNILHQEF